ncbi:hypothetical protein B0I35DRAFT_426322 [Stachybotrys elegans]|uniref:N-acetylgalactosaminide beta-1,3-galactosyltransferase n=1 Tax=Stachybotrys elegans TaxID=80388 RepID=A0A8K0WTE7_9HYPO|nr:hypothetical protein B0I35DRAFT_426322 [Stachybotrys elegans]
MLGLNKRFIRILTAGLGFVTLFFLLRYQNQLHEPHLLPPTENENVCATFPKDELLALVQPVLKMGHGERRDKIEAQFDTVCSCFSEDELLIYSDLGETVRGRRVFDILSALPESYFNPTAHPDIQHYDQQKQLQKSGRLDKDKEATRNINGWILDKYKFLPMVEKTWEQRPNSPFYFFLETDTYVFWTNAMRFLRTLDPDKPLYMGSPSPGRHDLETDETTWFANGGPGFVLSRGAVRALLKPKGSSSLTETWSSLLAGECCGDSVMGWALWNISIPLQGYWPLFNPHPLHGIPFGEHHWSQPPVTLHKTEPDDVRRLWQWEGRNRDFERPILYSDLWEFHHPVQPAIRTDWDGGEFYAFRPPPDAIVTTLEECERFCKEEKTCLQWLWKGRDESQCVLSTSFRLGNLRKPEELPEPEDRDEDGNVIPPDPKRKKRWMDFTTGWVDENIFRWRQEHRRKEATWVEPSITRIF